MGKQIIFAFLMGKEEFILLISLPIKKTNYNKQSFVAYVYKYQRLKL